jgi:uncharacterized protein
MPIGVIVNSLAVLFGGLAGALLGNKIPRRISNALTLTFGIASMSIGIKYIVTIHTLPAVIFALILGTAIGELLQLEKGIEWCGGQIRKPIERIFKRKECPDNQDDLTEKLVGIVVLFCASGTGICGALAEGMSGDHSLLLAKSILDFFTAGIFAATLGYIVMTIFIPQFLILITLFATAALIVPLTNAAMIADFTACGGMIMLATGFRICGLKSFPVASMLPGLFIIMPISHLWTMLIR